MTGKHMRNDELWINLLPSLWDKDVIKLGTARTRTIYNIGAYSPRSLTLVGDPSGRSNASLVQYTEIAKVSTRTYDVLIADEPEFVANCVKSLGAAEFVAHLSRTLKSNGILVLVVPDPTFGILGRRFALLRALRKSFGNRLRFFVCEPSTSEIQTLESLKGAIRSTLAQARRSLGGGSDRAWLSFVKALLKAILLCFSGVFNARGGLLLTARGESGSDARPSLTEELFVDSGIASHLNGYVQALHVTYQHRGPRHLLLIRDGCSDELLHIGKLEIVGSNSHEGGERECRNLQLISSSKEELALHGVHIPIITCSHTSNQRHEMIISAVRGVSMEVRVTQAITKRDHARLCQIIDSVSSIQRTIQSCLTARHITSVQPVSPSYFEDYLGLGLDWTSGDPQVISRFVQHGDFTVNNMLYDIESQRWGVIDWEAMSYGYPALFDWFSFLTSLKLTADGRPCAHTTKAYFNSFISTYFHDNELTEHLRSSTLEYCRLASIDSSLVFRCLTAFLVVNCNRLRGFGHRPDYQELWEEALRYTLSNNNLFTLVR